MPAITDEYSFLVQPRPAEVGGGWSLRVFHNELEMGGGVFPLAAYEGDEAAAHNDAYCAGSQWLDSHRSLGIDPSEVPY